MSKLFEPCANLPKSKSLADVWSYIVDKHIGYASTSLILDLGCGDGQFCLKQDETIGKGLVVGLDINTNPTWKASIGSHRVSFIQGDGYFLPVKSNCFDIVICNNGFRTLNMFQDPYAEIARCLKPKGYLFLFFGPNKRWRIDSPTHKATVKHYLTPNQVIKILESNELKLTKRVWPEIVIYRFKQNLFVRAPHSRSFYHISLNSFIRIVKALHLSNLVGVLAKLLQMLSLEMNTALICRYEPKQPIKVEISGRTTNDICHRRHA